MIVFIVEDDLAVADALSTALSNLDYTTAIYHDGETFLNEADPACEDVVLLDIGLPGMTGMEVAQLLSARARAPRVIAISGKPRFDLQQHLRSFPELTVLRKPLSVAALAAAVA